MKKVAARGYGWFGPYGGRYAPETLMTPLEELETAWRGAMGDARFRRELDRLLHDFAGRPTPLTRADRLSKELGGPTIWLKREDLLHTGAHKINNALGQALLTKRMGKRRVVAETGAGQHGVATATACAFLGLECVVYMGSVDMARQAPNVERMRLLGATVVPVESGTKTLKDAINEAMRDWVANVRETHYLLGSVLGPHPFPSMVAAFHEPIGKEARAQIRKATGRLPRAAVACVGGGSNAIGLFRAFLRDPKVDLVGVEAGGRGEFPASTPPAFSKGPAPASGSSTATAPTSCRTRTGRFSRPTRSPRGSITRRSAPSTRSCATSGGSCTSRPATRRRSPPSTPSPRSRGSSRLSSRPTPSPG